MKSINANFFMGVLLVIASLIFYVIQIAYFKTPQNTLFYFLQDLAFLPLQVVIVTIVLKKILSAREKKGRLKNINMAISAFFGEAGTEMILCLLQFSTKCGELKEQLEITEKWSNNDFKKASKLLKGYDFAMKSQVSSLPDLKQLLIAKRSFLLSMLENPNLLEHDTFTDTLWAVFHLTDELVARTDFTDLPDTDLNHLSIDMKRAFSKLLVEWINYIVHLKSDYPYLFSMAIRKNPFNEHISVIIR
ncbi:MAG: hypothetical protein WCI30_10305 [Clostridia bacterium]